MPLVSSIVSEFIILGRGVFFVCLLFVCLGVLFILHAFIVIEKNALSCSINVMTRSSQVLKLILINSKYGTRSYTAGNY